MDSPTTLTLLEAISQATHLGYKISFSQSTPWFLIEVSRTEKMPGPLTSIKQAIPKDDPLEKIPDIINFCVNKLIDSYIDWANKNSLGIKDEKSGNDGC